MHETVYEMRSRVNGCDHSDTLTTLFNIAQQQYNVGRKDEAHVTASRCLELARKNCFEDAAALCVEIISFIDEAREDADQTATVEQKRVQAKIRLRKQQNQEKVEE